MRDIGNKLNSVINEVSENLPEIPDLVKNY